jgi:hypothetical protein
MESTRHGRSSTCAGPTSSSSTRSTARPARARTTSSSGCCSSSARSGTRQPGHRRRAYLAYARRIADQGPDRSPRAIACLFEAVAPTVVPRRAQSRHSRRLPLPHREPRGKFAVRRPLRAAGARPRGRRRVAGRRWHQARRAVPQPSRRHAAATGRRGLCGEVPQRRRSHRRRAGRERRGQGRDHRRRPHQRRRHVARARGAAASVARRGSRRGVARSLRRDANFVRRPAASADRGDRQRAAGARDRCGLRAARPRRRTCSRNSRDPRGRLDRRARVLAPLDCRAARSNPVPARSSVPGSDQRGGVRAGSTRRGCGERDRVPASSFDGSVSDGSFR